MNADSVCVMGSFMMDLAVRAPRRPVAGETVVGTGFGMFLGGKGFNQAVAAARAGASTSMIGRLGDDEFGHQFFARMAAEGIDRTHVVVDATAGTGIGAPLTDDSGENSIVIVPRSNANVTPADVERAAPLIARCRVLLLQLELPIETALAAARLAKQAGALVVLNPAPAPGDAAIEVFRGLVDILVPNEVEARALCSGSAARDSADAATDLCRRTGAPVVMTLGGHGCIVMTDAGSCEIRAHSVSVVDTVGAGDAFCGALGRWLSAGATLHDAVVYANAAGALAVTRPGAAPAMPCRQAIVDLADATAGAPRAPSPLRRSPRRGTRPGVVSRPAGGAGGSRR